MRRLESASLFLSDILEPKLKEIHRLNLETEKIQHVGLHTDAISSMNYSPDSSRSLNFSSLTFD